MRVAYVSTDPGVPVFGSKGSSVHVQAVLRALLTRGAEVHLLTPRPGGEPPADLAPVRVHRLPLDHTQAAAERERALQRSDRHVGELLDELSSTKTLDLVYERYGLWARSAMGWARAHDVRSVLEVNAPLVVEQATHRVLVDRAGAEAIAREVMTSARTVICVSDPVAEWARRCTGRRNGIFTVPNGVDTVRVRPRAGRPSSAPFTVGFVGTLKPWHGVEDLVRAVADVGHGADGCRLLIVGDGPQRAAIEDLARSLDIRERVDLTGAVSPADVPALLAQMDVGVAPYPRMRDFYFSPLKVYEYLSAGLPVVGTAVGSLPEVLGRGSLGLLVEPGDPAALARAICELRARPELRRRLSAAGRRAAVADHDWNRVVGRILALSEQGDGLAARPPGGVEVSDEGPAHAQLV